MTSNQLSSLAVRLVEACVGACNCTTKTPEIQYHDEHCHYRLHMEASNALHAAAARAVHEPPECQQCDELIGERDHACDALQETHIALGGDGEWVARSPSWPPPDSGDLHLDVPELARERMAELERLRASEQPPWTEAYNLLADDAYAATFQSIGQYRTAVLGVLRGKLRPTQEPPAGLYTIEPHGDGHTLYRGRDQHHHGFNLARITEATPETLQLIERALNAAASQASQPQFVWQQSVWQRYYVDNGKGEWGFEGSKNTPAEPPAAVNSCAEPEPCVSHIALEKAEAALRACALYLSNRNNGNATGFNSACRAVEQYFEVLSVEDVVRDTLTKSTCEQCSGARYTADGLPCTECNAMDEARASAETSVVACPHGIDHTVTTDERGVWLCRKCGTILRDSESET